MSVAGAASGVRPRLCCRLHSARLSLTCALLRFPDCCLRIGSQCGVPPGDSPRPSDDECYDCNDTRVAFSQHVWILVYRCGRQRFSSWSVRGVQQHLAYHGLRAVFACEQELRFQLMEGCWVGLILRSWLGGLVLVKGPQSNQLCGPPCGRKRIVGEEL